MNEHKQVVKLLAVSRDLTDAERSLVDKHLKVCAACAEQLAAYQGMDERLTSLRQQDLANLPPPHSAGIPIRPHNNWARFFPWRHLGTTLVGQLAGLLILILIIIYLVTILRGARQAVRTTAPSDDTLTATSQSQRIPGLMQNRQEPRESD